MLLTEPLKYNGTILKVAEEMDPVYSASSKGNEGVFVPRAAASRPRAGIGLKVKKPAGEVRKSEDYDRSMPPPPLPAHVLNKGARSQEEFRKMLK